VNGDITQRNVVQLVAFLNKRGVRILSGAPCAPMAQDQLRVFIALYWFGLIGARSRPYISLCTLAGVCQRRALT
jgi:hypothetical protein